MVTSALSQNTSHKTTESNQGRWTNDQDLGPWDVLKTCKHFSLIIVIKSRTFILNNGIHQASLLFFDILCKYSLVLSFSRTELTGWKGKQTSFPLFWNSPNQKLDQLAGTTFLSCSSVWGPKHDQPLRNTFVPQEYDLSQWSTYLEKTSNATGYCISQPPKFAVCLFALPQTVTWF